LESEGIKMFRFLLIITLLSGSFFLVDPLSLQLTQVEHKIPSQTDWIDYGPVFYAGELGEWDYQLFGGFTASAVKKDGVFYLYYQGASGYRTWPDETVTWRAIGAATSSDGINFIKSEANPLISRFPTGNGEEGAVSAGVAVDHDGNIVIHYGLNTEEDESHVNADTWVAISSDGEIFQNVGIAIHHDDPRIWGSGDEIFPILSIQENDQWYVYYLPNGVVESGLLGVAWGDSYDNLTRSKRTRAGILPVQGWGSGSAAKISENTYALFISNIRKGTIQAHKVSLGKPHLLSLPVETYRFEEVYQASIVLDKETRTWFMFYRSDDYYGVKIAPAGEKDTTPPLAAEQLQGIPAGDGKVKLSWNPAEDPETGIASYRVYRDGEQLAEVKGWSYEDKDVKELTEYHYEVRAVNYHGLEGPPGESAQIRTLPDTAPPSITGASGHDSKVVVYLSEPVALEVVKDITNFHISGGAAVEKASLLPDGQSIQLIASNLTPGQTYTLTIHSLIDKAQTPNVVSNAKIEFTQSSIENLVGEWSFNEGIGDTAFDRSNFGNHGRLLYLDKKGPEWTPGISGSALKFDGIDNQVAVPLNYPLSDAFNDSYTIVLWARPTDTPINQTPNNAYYTILNIANSGLFYTADQQFRASVQLEDLTDVTVLSDPYDPGSWVHLAVVVDRVEKTVRLYIDGQEIPQSPQSFAVNPAVPAKGPIYLGTSDPLEGRYENRLKGMIDQVKVFARALNSEEVLILYQEEKP
jgi:hypothetical protein